MSRWRNPRLLVGVGLVCGSALIGALLVNSARDSTEYWFVRAPVKAGTAIEADDLGRVSGRLDIAAADNLVVASGSMPSGVWSRDVPAGNLLTRDAMVERISLGRQFPLAVAAGSVPADLATGHRIDVWSGPGPQTDPGQAARRLLTRVAVIAVSRSDGTGTRTVLVDTGVSGPQASVVADAASGHLTVVRVP